jgi:hypothetical protein
MGLPGVNSTTFAANMTHCGLGIVRWVKRGISGKKGVKSALDPYSPTGLIAGMIGMAEL